MNGTTEADPMEAAGAPAARSGEARSGRSGFGHTVEALTLALVTVALCVFFGVWGETSATFPTTANMEALLANQAVLGVATLAILVPLVCNQYDLSVGANLGLSAVLAAKVLSEGAPLPAAIAVALAVGALGGLVNGLVVTRGRVNAVVVTLGTALVMTGAVNGITGGQAIIQGIPSDLISFGSSQTLGVPNLFLVLVVLALLAWRVLEHMPIGRYLYALGSNEEAARLVGLRPQRLVLMSFVTAGLLAGAAGMLMVARTGGASPRVGETYTMPAFAAAFLSAAAIRPGRFNVFGAIVAIIFLAVLKSGLNLAGVQPYVSDIVNGVALVAGVALAAYLGRRRLRAARGS
ncbi:ABC transporter permease [Conexibacter arvalis]|uniref:Autoinducer 2 import system permease protein LsrD n=1 Tax=Conexibacter arvalis TaxID=912552 RepID=A0A840I7D1_9ACTN|nr:ABC transporter permease [Conexibacter arvalis]MBB4660767.1 ribose transport system permease protein [Conexibacter arvalis]